MSVAYDGGRLTEQKPKLLAVDQWNFLAWLYAAEQIRNAEGLQLFNLLTEVGWQMGYITVCQDHRWRSIEE